MDNYDPLKVVSQVRTWVEQSLSSLTTAPLAEARARYREVLKAIDQLEKLHIPVSDAINSEREELEKLISVADEREKLTSLAKELSSLARDINHQLRGMRTPGTTTSRMAPPKTLRVTFPDGTVICKNKATDTFIQSLQHIGLQRVSELPIRHLRHPLVSTQKDESAKNFRELEGYFIGTYSSTNQKAKQIRCIASILNVEISVEVID